MRRTLSTTARVNVFNGAGGICSVCKIKIRSGERWEVSHEIPIALGGSDTPANMRPIHFTCHKVQTATIDIPQIAKAKRQEALHIGAKRPKGTWGCGRNTPYKAKIGGGTVLR